MTDNPDRQWLLQEIARITQAMRETQSQYLRNDYGKYRRKLRRLLDAPKTSKD